MKIKNWSVVIGLFSTIHLPISASSAPLVINKSPVSTTFYNRASSITISQSTISLTAKSGSLILMRGHSEHIYLFKTSTQNKNYEFYFKADHTGKIQKTGIITRPFSVYFSEKCESGGPQEKVSSQLKEIADFIKDPDEIDLFSAIEESCNFSGNGSRSFADNISKEFTPKDSYLMTCLNNKEALRKISEFKSLNDSIPGILNSYFLELSSTKKSKPTFTIACEPPGSEHSAYNAKYNEKTRQIIFPLKDDSIKTGSCHNLASLFTHEYLHHSGLKNEKDLDILEAICAKANNLEGYKSESCKNQFKGSKCLENPDSCKQLGIPEAMKQAVSAEAKKDREEMIPILKEEVKDLTLENVVMEAPASSLSENSSTTIANSLPSTYDASVKAVSIAMQKNMNRLAAVADRAIEATISPAQASPKTTTTNSRAKSKIRLPAAAGNNNDPQEYVVEEIIADKYGVRVADVQKIERSLNEKTSRPNSNELAQTRGIETPKGTIASSTEVPDTGGIRLNSNLEAPRGARTVASVPAQSDNILGGQEVLGRQYFDLRKKYSDQAFVRSIQKENIRIEIPKENRKIGSGKSDATIYVDTGRSLIRKK